MSGEGDRGWHARPAEEALAALGSRPGGLTAGEAGAALRRHGENRLPEAARPSALRRFLAQFDNGLIWFLLAAGGLALALGHPVDGLVIVAVVLVNALVGFVQEGKAEAALAAIREMIAPHATVLRDGRRQRIDARHVVPGDIVALEAGDRVPADLRLIRARGLTADEAVLTGESVPAGKAEAPVPPDAALGDRSSMLHSGTLVATGQATGLVTATGAATEIGRISGLVGGVQTLTTPLLAQINRFGRRITGFAILLGAAVLALAVLWRGYGWIEGLMVVVALSVGLVPEGLPAVITITLAVGVRRMAARNAVVRRLPAVETLGATSVICSDKTGTLTRNEMTVRRVVTEAGETQVSGTGYAPEGALDGPPDDAARAGLIRAGLLCGDGRLAEVQGRWTVAGDPMDGALVALAAKAGLDPEAERAAWPRLDEIPFDAQHRFMAVLVRAPDGGRVAFVKGAPERVLAMCAGEAGERAGRGADGGAGRGAGVGTDGGALRRDFWRGRIEAAASEGERVLGFATKPLPPETEQLDFAAVEGGMTFLGIAGFIDPPRDEAVAAVADCRSAGIAVKMITGDHRGTAAAIARQLALADDPQAMDGAALEHLSDEELRRAAAEVSVFARATPEHKLRIVRALQAAGHVVAMTGDGVNDAPAVKQADVGIAMGRKGTEAAKEAAQMVLVDDNFASIAAAVHEGRTVYDNIRKVIGWTLPTNGGETLVVILAILFNLTLPMTPLQILWVNMVLEVTLGLVLAFEPPEPGVMRRPPRRRDAPILSAFLIWRIVFVSVLFAAGVFAVFSHALSGGRGVAVAQTMVVNALVVMEIAYLFNIRFLHMSSFSLKGALGTRPVLIALAVVAAAQAAFTWLAPLQRLFGSAPLTPGDGLLLLALGAGTMALLEIEKALTRRLWPRAMLDA